MNQHLPDSSYYRYRYTFPKEEKENIVFSLFYITQFLANLWVDKNNLTFLRLNKFQSDYNYLLSDDKVRH